MLTQAEGETIYGVTFAYLTYLYAAEQLEVADDAVNYPDQGLKYLQELAQTIVKTAARRDVTKHHVDMIGAYILNAQGRREEAVQGKERALSALREAMGVGPDCPLQIADSRLPPVNPTVDKDQIIATALARRGEIVQALTATQVVDYEVCAQQVLLLPSTRTFAAGSDLHAHPIPAGEQNDHYKPGALGIEMPPMLTGCRSDRVEQARIYSARTASVADKTRNLITLEAEQAYYRWLEASQKEPKFRQSADEALKVFKGLHGQFDPRIERIRLDELINSSILYSQFRIQANQAHYQQLLALAALERVTAGGFCAGLDQVVGLPAGDNNRNGAKQDNSRNTIKEK
jgi:outer membrane protein TolC